jgi:cell division protein FtsB
MGKLIRFRRQAKAKDEAARALFPPFQSPTDARPASYPTDAAANEAGRPGVAPDPIVERKKLRQQRGVVAALVLVFMGGIAAALFGDHGYLDAQRQERRFRELKELHEANQLRVEAIRKDIERLRSDPAAIERIAREDLGYVAPGELTLLLPGEDPDESRGLDAKTGSGIVPAVRSTQ